MNAGHVHIYIAAHNKAERFDVGSARKVSRLGHFEVDAGIEQKDGDILAGV